MGIRLCNLAIVDDQTYEVCRTTARLCNTAAMSIWEGKEGREGLSSMHFDDGENRRDGVDV